MSVKQATSPRAFAETVPAVVRGLAAGEDRAWDEFYCRYKGPLIVYLRYKLNLAEDRAEAMFQNFIGDMSRKQTFFAAWQPAKGKFRNYLLTALVRHAISQLRKERDWDPLEEARLKHILSDPTEETADTEWTRAVLAETLRRVHDHYEAAGKLQFWRNFEQRLVTPILDESPKASYDDLIAQCGFQSPQQAFNALLDAKRTFKKFLNQVVADLESEPTASTSQVRRLKAYDRKGRKP